MADYNSSYTGVQIDTAVGKALAPDSTPTAESAALITSGAVKAAMDGKMPVYGMGENLLDNWYFLNPVNQRGLTTYSGAVRGIDRWVCRAATGTVALSSSGLTFSIGTAAAGDLYQYTGQTLNGLLLNKTVTVSVLLDGNRFVTGTKKWTTSTANIITESDFYISVGGTTPAFSNFYIRVNATITMVAIKLELGTEQTLAHLEGSTWVLNEIPDYGAELIKCQTSTADSADTYANKTLATEQQIAYVESGTTASRAYAIGDLFVMNGLLYQVKAEISSGDTITPGTNCEAKNLESVIKPTLYTGTAITNTVAGLTYTAINQVSLPAGFYIIVGSASNTTNVAGSLCLNLLNYETSITLGNNRSLTDNGGGCTVCALVKLESATTRIRMRATQTTGSSLSLATNTLTAIKLY